MFTNSISWYKHEFKTHWVDWYCRLCQHSSSSRGDLETHTREQHAKDVTEGQIPALMSVSHRSKNAISPYLCPFCDDWGDELSVTMRGREKSKLLVTPHQYRLHVAGHMEQLALFALPRAHPDGSDYLDSMEANGGLQSRQLSEIDDNLSVVTEVISDPPLHQAAFVGDGVQVIRILRAGGNVNSRGPTWGSALGAAVAGEHPAVVRLLLDNGADVYMPCHDFETALEAAASTSNQAVGEVLLRAHESEVRKERYDACKRRFQQVVEVLSSTCALMRTYMIPNMEYIQYSEEAREQLEELGRELWKIISQLATNSDTARVGLDKGFRTIDIMLSSIVVICDSMTLVAKGLGLNEQVLREYDWAKPYPFWPRLETFFKEGSASSLSRMIQECHEMAFYVTQVTQQ